MRGKASRGNTLVFGDYALQALEASWITSRQIEAARRAMTRQVRRGGQIWIRLFPDKPVTMRPAETRMGSGKGAPEFWVAVVKPGKVLYELKGVPESVARVALRLAASKLPVVARWKYSESPASSPSVDGPSLTRRLRVGTSRACHEEQT